VSVRLFVSQSVPSVSLSHQSNAAAACGGFAAERHTRKRYRSTAPGARQQQRRSPALSSKCGQCHVDSQINEAEHRLGLVSILGLLKFQQCSLLVWNLCPDGNMHGIIYRHIGRTGIGWIDGQKSPVIRRGKSGNPSLGICLLQCSKFCFCSCSLCDIHIHGPCRSELKRNRSTSRNTATR